MDGFDCADHECSHCGVEVYGEPGDWTDTYGNAFCEASPSQTHRSVRVYFNPFNHTIEENNEFIRRGWEVMPIRVPPTDRDLKPRYGD